MGLDIATGMVSPTPDPVHPIDASATPGVQQPTAIQPGQLSGPTYPGFDGVPYFADPAAAGERDCQAAMDAAMSAEDGRRQHYSEQVLPIGSTIGQLMQFPPATEDPGAGVGNTVPTAGFYDPPRQYGQTAGASGAPEYVGNEPPPGYQGPAQ